MTDLFDQEDNGATFSQDRKYRYALWRIWDKSKPKAMCIGLNPSNANEGKNDPTIDNLRKMLHKLGYGGFYMTNLYAWISSKPENLLKVEDPVGGNDTVLNAVKLLCEDVIFCWGNFTEAEARIEVVVPKFPNAKCFGFCKSGRPWHPLALMYNGTVNNPKLMDYAKVAI